MKRQPVLTVPRSPALMIWERLTAAGVELRAGANGRIIASPRHRLTNDLADGIRAHRAEFLDYLATGHLGALVPADAPCIPFDQWQSEMLAQQAAAERAARKNDL